MKMPEITLHPINWAMVKHPVNWVTVWAMIAVGAIGFHYIIRFTNSFGNNSEKKSNG